MARVWSVVERAMTPNRPSLQRLVIGVMCSSFERRDLIRAVIRSCGAHGISLNQFGAARNATVPLTIDAIVIDVNHLLANQAINTAAAGRVPIVACAFGDATPAVRARLKLSRIRLIIDPNPDTLCEALISAIEQTGSAVKRKRA
jgi:hypothetical protein